MFLRLPMILEGSLISILVGETKDQDHLCSSRAGLIDVHCDLPCQAWRQHLPQHQEASLAQGTGHGMAQQTWSSQCSKISRHWLSPGAQQMAAVWVLIPRQNLHELHQAPSSKSKGTFALQENTLPTTLDKL